MIGFSKHKVLDISNITNDTFIIRFERNNLKFVPGQFIVVGLAGDYNTREYSIYSSIEENYLEILVREIKDGYLSSKLKYLKKGDNLIVYGPFGEFIIDEKDINEKEFVMIATGTGISPIHSIVTSFPAMNYKILHGVRYANEAYGFSDYDSYKFVLCSSKERKVGFDGRVTSYMKDFETNSKQLFYLSGNNEMITQVIDMLKKKGVKPNQYNLEIYF
jgi:ferredoxin/flavodoxin---NADP+ reductase